MAPKPHRPRLPDCTGALVAGGQGSRLGGAAKGLLRLGGEPLVARALRVFDGLFAESVLVANDAAPYAALPVRATPDLLPGRGAPGGLHAALSAARTRWVFTAACDMPFLDAAQIAWLAARREGAPAVAVVWRGRLQPLHAFWSTACLPEIDRLLRQGQPSMWQLATAVGARLVPEESWREVDPEGRAFENVNTPEDAARLGLEVP
ncbi:molybdenum cofactor guanylyltransferase [Anaeromyxobacter diazotrophicus]|uniref:Probable molybdenum cofactor guanylyltransferase n=1 Tax=Anaeromyxobacter diazotrophicus TaxID=2590199 RepID=A0A7I9VGL8_9BACT|nr:molybdenum cofactor guanylyltransferase [Anaeromyxobacter diazotrophicus]GEJ55389.1 putative molybdenum cofactor guanylyltransferase [Anaeromyxobacter diazotrophicus]